MVNKIPTQSLQLNNLSVQIDDKEIVHAISLKIKPGEVHVLMGPNGSGKSTLAQAIAGYPELTISSGKIMLDGKDITKEKPDERAKAGLFLSMQQPPAIPGVSMASFLRTARNAVKKDDLSVMAFFDLLTEKMRVLHMDPVFAQRDLNEGFSGGERKRAEILQMMILEPAYAILDETDSGLDVDAIKTVANGIKIVQKTQKTGLLLITHHKRFLEEIEPTHVHIMKNGMIVESGGPELVDKIESQGFNQ